MQPRPSAPTVTFGTPKICLCEWLCAGSLRLSDGPGSHRARRKLGAVKSIQHKIRTQFSKNKQKSLSNCQGPITVNYNFIYISASIRFDL